MKAKDLRKRCSGFVLALFWGLMMSTISTTVLASDELSSEAVADELSSDSEAENQEATIPETSAVNEGEELEDDNLDDGSVVENVDEQFKTSESNENLEDQAMAVGDSAAEEISEKSESDEENPIGLIESLDVDAVGANTTSASAISVSVNKKYRDNLTTRSDENWYKFNVASAGYISLLFEHEYIESTSGYWCARLYDKNQQELSRYTYTGKTVTDMEGNIGIPAGTYYLRVNKDWYYSDVNYNFKINYTASNTWETEFNDSYASADVVEVNKTIHGSLRSNDDTDWYKFTTSKNGYISLSFAHEYIENNSGYWYARLYDKDQQDLAAYTFTGKTVTSTEGNIGLPAGTYYLRVNKDWYHSSVDYNFKINYTASNEWEMEFNDSYSKANTMNVNKMVYGSLKNGDDTDWYKFTISKNGYISLNFAHEYIENGSGYWKARLYDKDRQELAAYTYAGTTVTAKEGNIGVPAGTYFVRVNKDWYYSSVNYSFKINYVSSDAWETEFNESYQAANVIKTNSTVHGSIRNRDDIDWYKFSISQNGNVALSFSHGYINSGSDYWNAWLYNSKWEEIGSYKFKGNVTSSKTETLFLPAGTYTIKITDGWYFSANDYSLVVGNYVPASKVTLNKTSNTMTVGSTLTLKASVSPTNALSKTVTWSSGNTSVATVSSSGKITAKSPGKAVITAKTYNGKTAKCTVTVIPKGTPVTKLQSTKAKSLNIQWRSVVAVSGYQMQYCTRSDMKGAKSASVAKAGIRSYTRKDLLRGTRYYVRVRTYKVVNGTKYYSSWSGIKSCVVK